MTDYLARLATIDLGSSSARTAHRDVIDRLRRAMLTGVLPAGTRLVQADLARSLQVSVTPVREALRDLINEGLVDFDAYRGATVHSPTLEELEDIYEIRMLLTPAAVREALAHISDAEIDRAELVAHRMDSVTDPAEWVDLNREFHLLLTAGSRRPHLQAVVNRMSDLSSLYIGVSIGGADGPRKRGNRDHAALIRSYRRRDVDRAISVTMKHINETLDDARKAMRQAGLDRIARS